MEKLKDYDYETKCHAEDFFVYFSHKLEVTIKNALSEWTNP